MPRETFSEVEKAELKKMFDQFTGNMGIHDEVNKGVMSLENTNFDDLLPRENVEELLELQRQQNGWLMNLNNVTRSQAAGTVPILDIAEPVTIGVDEDDPSDASRQADTRRAPYRCRKFKSQWNVTWEDLREAKAIGLGDWEDKLRGVFMTAIGNDKANVAINGDVDLPSTTPLNMLLNRIDGLRKKMLAGSNVYNFGGETFSQWMFGALMDNVPERYKEEAGARWMYNSSLELRWKVSLSNVNTTERMRSTLGDQTIASEIMVPPMGKPQILVPQISGSQGPTAIAPTSAATSGNGIKFILTTLVTAAYVEDADAGVGRKFKVICNTTGKSEVVTGALDSTNLAIITAGTLGQTSVSGSASDYVVTLYDETDVYFGNPKLATIVDCTEMRSYRKYNQDRDRFEIVVYHEFDLVVPAPEIATIGTRVRLASVKSAA